MARSELASPYFTLNDFRKRFHMPRCRFNGVENPDENAGACNHIWQQWERDSLSLAIEDAEGMLAEALRFWIGPRYLVDYDHEWRNPIQLKYGYVVGGGERGRTEVTPSASDFTVDPATITVPQADFTNGQSEVVLVEDDSGLKIEIDDITEAGTDYVLSIYQCNLIRWGVLEEQQETIDYDALFPLATWLKLADVTVYREYLDTSDQATITYGPACNCWCSGTACEGEDHTGCVYVIDQEISAVRVSRAGYSDGSWTCDSTGVCGCYCDDKVTVKYQAGTTSIPGWQRAVVQLALSQLDWKPCGCDIFDNAWRRATKVPEILTAERLNCKFGGTEGAWYAWSWVLSQQHGRGYILG